MTSDGVEEEDGEGDVDKDLELELELELELVVDDDPDETLPRIIREVERVEAVRIALRMRTLRRNSSLYITVGRTEELVDAIVVCFTSLLACLNSCLP